MDTYSHDIIMRNNRMLKWHNFGVFVTNNFDTKIHPLFLGVFFLIVLAMHATFMPRLRHSYV